MTVKPAKLVYDVARNADIMNNIKDFLKGNDFYQNTVPTVTYDRESYVTAGRIIVNDPDLRNAFVGALMKNFAFIFGSSKVYYDRYQKYKKGLIEVGEIIEEIYVEMAKPNRYNPEIASTELWKRVLPDVKASLYIFNVETFYKQTINRNQLASSFTSDRGLYDLTGMIINSMSSGLNLDTQYATKYLIGRQILNGGVYMVTTPEFTPSTKYQIATMMKKISNDMTFANEKFNVANVKNWSDIEYQNFWLSTTFDAEYTINVLSAAYQLRYADFMGKVEMFDDLTNIDFDRLNEFYVLGEGETIEPYTDEEKLALQSVQAIIMDDGFLQIYQRLMEFGSEPNKQAMEWQNWLHYWGVYSSSIFAPCVAFTTQASTVTSVTVSPKTVSLPVGGSFQAKATVVGTGFYNKNVLWNSSDNEHVTVDTNGNINVKTGATGDYTITAMSISDPTKTDTLTLTVI